MPLSQNPANASSCALAEVTASGTSVATGVFSRKSSGLIRVGGTLDVFIFNVGLVSVGIAIAYNQYYGPSLYPGAQPWISTMFAVAGMLFVAAAFYCWSVIFPRSGGVYVFLSRTISPGVAFVMSLIETIILLYYGALAAGLIVQVGLSSFFGAVGMVGRNATLTSWGVTVAKPAGVFWIGALIIIVAGALLISGTRRYFTVQRVLFVVAVAGLAVIAVVMLAGSRKGSVRFHVVGSGLVPTGPHNGYADGGWVTSHGYDALFRGFKFHVVLITLAPSARGPHAAQMLNAAITKTDKRLKGIELGTPDPIPAVAELKEVEQLPILLGGFLALLAIGAVGHALATAVRRRSHDFAVLRALGMTQRQCRWVVVTQASVLAAIGLLFGIPIGLAVGRSVWRVVADYTPIAYVPPMAVLALLLIAPGALLLANLLAAWPGRRAARLRVAHILRAE